ncbi:MAG: porin, partial [Bacteroidota bacterium]
MQAQTQDTTKSKRRLPRFYLDNEKKTYIDFHTYAQIWARTNTNNPGSLIDNRAVGQTNDISIRRYRLGLSGQAFENTFFYVQIGANNINHLSERGASADILDAYAYYRFSKAFSIGAGKSAWHGLSRFSAPSASKSMVGDLNFMALPTLNITDDLIRNLSFFIKGKLKKLDYRLVFINPSLDTNSSLFSQEPIENQATFTAQASNMQYSVYLKYEFLEEEGNTNAFHVGTHLGKKSVFSLGAGFTYQNNALWSLVDRQSEFHDMRLLSADAFLDIPLNYERKTALTAYLAYFNYDFGPNYIRNLGVNNTANGLDESQASFNGIGNAFALNGTGEAIVGNFGYLFQKMGKRNTQLQPYLAWQYSNFEAVEDRIFQFDLGLNWYLNGHQSKLTFNAQNRPILFKEDTAVSKLDRKWMLVLQYQF